MTDREIYIFAVIVFLGLIVLFSLLVDWVKHINEKALDDKIDYLSNDHMPDDWHKYMMKRNQDFSAWEASQESDNDNATIKNKSSERT